jgi:hypothetical protein
VWGPAGSAGAGGGGGAGGAIWIVASTARISGSATARGGAGGDPYTTPCYGGGGGAGAAGRIRVDAPTIETPGTVSPTPFSSDPGLPAVGAASLFQPDDDTVAVRNDGASAIDVRILAIVP